MSCPMARILLKRGSRHDARVGGPTVPSHAKPYLSVQMRTLVHYAQSFTEAIKAVYPQARFQADHFHTVKNIWGHLKKSLLSYRRKIKAQGDAHHDEQVMERAKTLWKLRWSLLKKPANLSLEEKKDTS